MNMTTYKNGKHVGLDLTSPWYAGYDTPRTAPGKHAKGRHLTRHMVDTTELRESLSGPSGRKPKHAKPFVKGDFQLIH